MGDPYLADGGIVPARTGRPQLAASTEPRTAPERPVGSTFHHPGAAAHRLPAPGFAEPAWTGDDVRLSISAKLLLLAGISLLSLLAVGGIGLAGIGAIDDSL